MKAIFLLAGAFCALSSGASAQEVYIKNGFLTGEAYLNLDNASQAKYAMGVVDGLLLAPFVGAPSDRLGWMQDCVVNMSDTQVAAMLAQQLRANPGSWHQSAHVQMYVALNTACPQSPYNRSRRSDNK